MMLTDKQIADFQKHYQTESERFQILPPGIYPDRKYSAQIPNSREIYRQKNGITEQQNLLLQVGSDFGRKGVDRSIEALASLPESLRHNTLLFVVGGINHVNLKRWQKNSVCVVMCISSPVAMMCQN